MRTHGETNRTSTTPSQNGAEPVFTPAVDIAELPAEFVLRAEMPGATPESLNVTAQDGSLVLEATCPTAAPAGYTAVRREFGGGTYRRVFDISDRIDTAAIKASLKNGVLRVALPKKQEAQPRKVPIALE